VSGDGNRDGHADADRYQRARTLVATDASANASLGVSVDVEGVVGLVVHCLAVDGDAEDAVVAHHKREPVAHRPKRIEPTVGRQARTTAVATKATVERR
jgi:hypothetical protein